MTLWNRRIIALAFALGGTLSYASAQDDSKNIIEVPGKLSETEEASWKNRLPTDGWLLLRFKEGDRLLNLSHKEYVLHLWLNCAGDDKADPGYLVEYSDAYRDGDYGGLDFMSSGRDDGKTAHFLLDGKDYNDPFAKENSPKFQEFAEALKKAKQLTLSVYDTEMNPETGKDEPRLNRSINFKLAHGGLLERPVNCGR